MYWYTRWSLLEKLVNVENKLNCHLILKFELRFCALTCVEKIMFNFKKTQYLIARGPLESDRFHRHQQAKTISFYIIGEASVTAIRQRLATEEVQVTYDLNDDITPLPPQPTMSAVTTLSETTFTTTVEEQDDSRPTTSPIHLIPPSRSSRPINSQPWSHPWSARVCATSAVVLQQKTYFGVIFHAGFFDRLFQLSIKRCKILTKLAHFFTLSSDIWKQSWK